MTLFHHRRPALKTRNESKEHIFQKRNDSRIDMHALWIVIRFTSAGESTWSLKVPQKTGTYKYLLKEGMSYLLGGYITTLEGPCTGYVCYFSDLNRDGLS